MASKFLSPEAQFRAGVNAQEGAEKAPADTRLEWPEQLPLEPNGTKRPAEPQAAGAAFAAIQNQEDAPPCTICGAIMVRSGSCYKCVNCGSTSGCA
jgi:ribonucleoside-diphosphate reductase alpha chain